MIIALMQPYFFPYIGYFQLMHEVDEFVIYDDVQYVTRGWINRNLIRLGNTAKWLTMPVRKAARETLIRDRRYLPKGPEVDNPLLHGIEACYSNATHFSDIFPMIHQLVMYENRTVSEFNANLLTHIARQLGISCKISFSSNLKQVSGLKGQAKVIEICQHIGASRYINPAGGTELYDQMSFQRKGMHLSFLRTTTPATILQDGPRHLSIIDWLMHEGITGTRAHLTEYEVVEGH